MFTQGGHQHGVSLTLKGTVLSARGALTAGVLRQLARWASNVGPIVINGHHLSAKDLNHMAQESERSGEPVYFEGDNGSFK